MAKDLEIHVERDHLESLTRASGATALCELIWNALDADAKEIRINYEKNILGKYESIIIEDDGHGLSYQDAEDVFQKIGGSEKKIRILSPGGRAYHGKEGKGRFKAYALGEILNFESVYQENGSFKKYRISTERAKIKSPHLNDLQDLNGSENNKSGFKVEILNVNDKNASEVFEIEDRKDLEEKFAAYYISYPMFSIYINGHNLDFTSLIKNTYEEDITYGIKESENEEFKVKIIEWNFDNKKKTYLCNEKGIPYKESSLGIRSSIPISIFIQSKYIDKLQRENVLDLAETDPIVNQVISQSKVLARKYVRERLHFYSKEFIEQLKKENIYPFTDEPKEEVDIAKRQVFDIVALQVNEYVPSFSEQDNSSKKLTLALIKEALENDGSNLHRILAEVIELPDEKRDELKELLDKTSLVDIIDTMKQITHRITLLQGLEQLIYDPEHSRKVKERKHLHKIVVKELWMFGDEYTYGADDITLKNVLKQYLKDLGREDFEEIIENSDNSDLGTIPDVCLWQQYSLGKPGNFENLIIELKKPIVDAGVRELNQIIGYAQKVANDSRFPKDKTKWKFILLTRKVKEDEIGLQMNQQNRNYGHVVSSANLDVWVIEWGSLLNLAKARYEYVKGKLNLKFQNDTEGIELLRRMYKQYLPEEF
jgi:Histidine kinase-, DNA gyrase B-, and HSP90-like ATPase